MLPRGIRLRAKTYWVDVRVGGHRIRRPAGHALEDAVRLRATLLGSGCTSTVPTFERVAARYSRRLLSTAKPSSLTSARKHLKALAQHFRGSVDEFGPDDLGGFIESRLRSVGAATVNADLRVLRAALRLALEDEVIQRLPFRIKMLRTPRRTPTILPSDQFRRVLAAAGRNVRPVLELAAYTGLRNGELCALRWCDIDLDVATLHVAGRNGWSPKSHRDRVIPLNSQALAMLRRIRTGRDGVLPVFVGVRGATWSPERLSRAVAIAFKRAGCYQREGKPGLHMLRRTFLSTLLHNGADLETARDLAGHASITTTSAYLASTDAVKRRAVESLAG